MSVLEALILGILQGLTEFLPISSSGHIELGKVLLDIQKADSLTFTVLVHGATVLSTIVIFRKDIWALLKNAFSLTWSESNQYVVKLLISMIPVGIVGVLWEDQVNALFSGRLVLVGIMLLITAFILYLTRYAQRQDKNVGFGQALVIGLSQAMAVMPGISRSGATIGTALLLGVKKEKATRFSFLMVLVPILGATALKVKELLAQPAAQASADFWPMAVGFLGAFLAGLAACQWMVALVRKGKLIYFALYCLLIGGIAIISGMA